MSINLSRKCSQNLLDHAKQSLTNVLKNTSKRVIKKTAEATHGLIGNRIVNTIKNTASQRPPLFNSFYRVVRTHFEL